MTKASDILETYKTAVHNEVDDFYIELTKAQFHAALKAMMPEKLTHYQQESKQTKREKAYFNQALTEVDKALAQFFGVELTKGEE
jgi:hypothetical protein